MKLTKVAAASAALLMASALTACGGGSDSASGFGNCDVTTKKNSIKLKPVQADTLTVETTLPVPGWFNGTTPEGIEDGFEYCMAADIANAAGLSSVTVKNVSFDQLVLGRTNNFDVAFAESTITPERAKVVDFSEPYYESNIGVLVKADSGITQQNLKQHTLGAYTGTTSVTFLEEELGVQGKIYPDSQALYQGVLSGQIDAAFLDTAIVLAQAKNSNGQLEVVGQFKTGEVYGGIFPKGSPNQDAINGIIKQMRSDGTLDRLSKKWLGPAFGGDPNSVPVWSVGQ